MPRIISDRRLWLNTDGDLVEDGDPSAAFLWAGEGAEVDAGEAERLGYQPADDVEPEPEDVDATVAEPDEAELCAGTTAAGEPCSKKAGDDGYCHLHSE